MTHNQRKTLLIMLGGALVVAISMGVRQSFGLFLQPVVSDLAISREVFGLAIALQNLVWGVAQPLAGMVADKYGSGRVIVAGGLLYLAGLALTAGAHDGPDLYLSFGLLIGLGLAGTTFAVVLGAVGRAVAPQRRAMALALVSAGGSFGMFVMVPGAQTLLAQLGWVNALYVLAGAAALMPLLAMAVGGGRGGGKASVVAGADSLSRAMAEARGHGGYWLLTLGFFVCGFHVTFIATHLPSYLTDQSLAPMVGAWALACIGFVNIVGTYVGGLFGGRYRKKNLLSYLYFARAGVIALFLALPLSNTTALLFAGAMGLLWLGTIPLTSGLVAEIFGMRYMSTLFGMVFLSHQLGSFLGAWLGGYFYDLTGSYDTVWMAAAVLGVVAALLHWPINDRPIERAPMGPEGSAAGNAA
jgi:MFS family permease